MNDLLASITPLRWMLASLALIGLGLVYIFQRIDVTAMVVGLFQDRIGFGSDAIFAINRILRYIVNDFLAILLVYALFADKRLVQLAFIIQVAGLLLIMVPYLLIKLNLEGDSEISSPLLSFWHRMIVNPVLILLLIPAKLYKNSK